MEELKKLADRLQTSIDFAIKHKEDLNASSWNYQEGVLLNHNEAKSVVELVKKFDLCAVVNCVYVVTETDNYGQQLFKEVFKTKEQAIKYLQKQGLKEDNINEINEIELE